MELICWKMPPTEKIGFPAASIHCSTLFHGHSNAVSQICKGQVCYQEQLATSRYSRSPSQSKPQKNPSSPTEAVHVKAEDTSGFHPNLKRYWPSAEALQDELNSGISCISYSTTVLFDFILHNCPVWRGLPSLSNSVLPDLFLVCNRVTYWNHIYGNNSNLKISPERVGTSCWIHLNKDCHQKKNLPNHRSRELLKCDSVSTSLPQEVIYTMIHYWINT